MTDDFADIVDKTETVRLYRRLTESTFDNFANSVEVTKALGRPLRREELIGPNASRLHKGGKVWHLWKSELGTVVPKIGDKIVDADGVAWSILPDGIDTNTWGSRYQITTAKER